MRRKYENNYDDEREMKRQKCVGAGSSFGSPIVSLEVNDGEDLEDLELDSSKMEIGTKDSTTNCNRGLPKEKLNDVMSETERKLPFESCGDKKSSSLFGLSKQRRLNRNEDQEVQCIEIDLSDSSSGGDKGDEKVKPVIGPTASQHPVPNNDRSDSSDSDYFDWDAEFRINKKPSLSSKEDPYKCKKSILMKKKPYDSSDDKPSHYAQLQREEKHLTAVTKVHNPCGQPQTSPTEKKHCYLDSGSLSHSSDSTVSLPMEMLSSAMKENKKMTLKSKEGKFGALSNRKGRVSFINSDDIEVYDDDQGSGGADFSFDAYGEFDEDDDELTSKDSALSRPCTEEPVKATQDTKPKLKTFLHDDIEVLDVDSDCNSSKSSAELFTPRPFKKHAIKPAALNTQPSATKLEKRCPNSSFSSSKLSTPCAFSPAITSPTLGAYAKRKVPTPAIPAMSASLVKEIGGESNLFVF